MGMFIDKKEFINLVMEIKLKVILMIIPKENYKEVFYIDIEMGNKEIIDF